MVATNEDIYRELKLLRAEIKELRNLIVPAVQPEGDELGALREGGKEFKAGEYIDWRV